LAQRRRSESETSEIKTADAGRFIHEFTFTSQGEVMRSSITNGERLSVGGWRLRPWGATSMRSCEANAEQNF
jgi:hypothetical protein